MSVQKPMLRRQSLLVAVFLCIELLDEIVDGLSSAAWPLIREDLDLNYIELGLLFSIPNFVAYVVEPPIGLLGDAWRRFALIALGGLTYATSMVMFAGATNFHWMLAAMALMYPASGTFVSLSQSSMMDVMPDDRERGMVIWTVAGSIGVAAGPLLLAGAIALGATWRDAYLLVGAVAFVLTAALWLTRPPQAARKQRAPFGEVARSAWTAVREPNVLRWLGLLAAADLLLEVFVGFLALYFVDSVGGSVAVGALAVTIWTVAALSGEASLIALLRRFDGLAIVRRSAVVVTLLLIVFLLIEGATPKLVLLGFIGLFSAGWYSIMKAQYFDTMADRTGVAMAVSAAIIPIQGALPAAVGFVAEYWGLQTALWIVLLAPLAIVVFARPPAKEPPTLHDAS